MPKIFLSLIICFVFFTTNAQKTDSLLLKKDSIPETTEDFILKRIISLLPPGWVFTDNKDEFIITRKDSIYIANKSLFNLPKNKKLSSDTIMIYGEKIQSKIIYRVEPRWTTEQNLKANSNNAKILSQINQLPEKYNITHLADKSKSSRESIVYTGKTNEEKELINKYENEKTVLRKNLIQKPIYHTEKYSLYLISTTGGNYNNFSIYPESAYIELYTILSTFFELTEKSY